MKILDRYIIKQFLLTTMFGILAFTLFFLVIDMMENLDDFIDHDVGWHLVILYYVVFAPEIIKLMTPVGALFGSLFTAGKMSNQNELTAIKAGGISFYRFMVPVIVISFLISGFLVGFGGYVVPMSNKKKISIEMEYLKRNITPLGNNIFFQDTRTRIVNISFFDESRLSAVKVSIQEFDPNDLSIITGRYDLQRLVYDTLSNQWIGYDGKYREFSKDGNGQSLTVFDRKPIEDLNFLPQTLTIKQRKVEEMDLTELSEVIAEQRKAGHDPRVVEIEYYSRFSFAMTAVIVVFFGLPLSASKRRSGMALQFGINLLITFIYLGFMQIIQALGKNGGMDPLLTAWLVNIVFAFAALVNLLRVKN